MPSPLGNFPSINELLESPPLKSLVDRVNPTRMISSVRSFVDGMRQEVQTAVSQRQIPSPLALAEQIANWIVRQEEAGVRNVLNATGILLHPEFGGAPLADEALAALRGAAASYSRLPAAGTKPLRVEQLLQKLIGCEAAIVIANPALAIALTTHVLACGRDVLLPRQQMVAAPDGSRTYEMLSSGGGLIREIGAVNELTQADLANAGEPAFLFWQQGLPVLMQGQPQPLELSQVVGWANRISVPTVVDLGNGGLHDCAAFGLEPQPTAAAAIAAGAALVLLRGDGLLGGPSCGVIAGKQSLISQLAAHPLARAAACDKSTLAALEATLQLYQPQPEQHASHLERAIPLLGLLATSEDNLKHRSERLLPQLATSPALAGVESRTDFAHLTAAKLSSQRLPTWGLALQPAQGTAADLLIALSNTTPAIICTLAGDRVWLDLRAISPREDQQLVTAVNQLVAPK
jgi:L-seryl-tRNA(Ser) seleniumtransferase